MTMLYSTILYENNSACALQMQASFIKGNQIKHIDRKYSNLTDDLIRTRVSEIKKIILADNLANLFTKALPVSCSSSTCLWHWHASIECHR